MSTITQSAGPSTSTDNFTAIFNAASTEYARLTGRRLDTHPFAAQLDACDSPKAVSDLLRAQAQAFSKFRKGDEKLMAVLDPTVHILFTFSATLGEGIGLPFSPAKTIFTGIGILLGAVKDVAAGHEALIHIFWRIHLFLQRLNRYTGMPLTGDMTELLGKIMSQVLSILALSTKEMDRRIQKILKKLAGRTDVEDAVLQLDMLTKEGSLMVVVRNLEVTHRIPQFIYNAGVPPATHQQLSPGSPLSPLGSDPEHYPPNDGDSSTALRNVNGNNSLDVPNQRGPGSPTSLAPSAASIPSTTVQRHAKPKRLRAIVTSKNYSIPMVPRDSYGRPLLPLDVGIMTVNYLGEVCMREHFHTERYIFPVGYSVNRRYLSARDPNAETVYNCTILDGGDGPRFQIIANDIADKPIIAATATGAWSVVVRATNYVRHRQPSNSVSGPDFFGLSQNTIKHLIQELPGADRLKDYVWQNFKEEKCTLIISIG